MIKRISVDEWEGVIEILNEIYPNLEKSILFVRWKQMFSYSNYYCWGYFEEDTIIGICGAWITERLYCGKQLEIDNFIVLEEVRSQGIGLQLVEVIEQFAKENDCHTIELNSYVTASKAHKFYFRNGYRILGYHFEKELSSK